MIEKICNYLTNKIRKTMPEIDDERAEIINYGLNNIIGEVPKFFLILIIAYICGILELTLLAFFSLLPYRAVAGGFHLKTHIGCFIGTTIFYCGNAFISQYIVLESEILKYLIILGVWVFSLIMVTLYSPADTENIPILRKKERKIRKILSYIIVTIILVIAIFIKVEVISNILILGVLLQSISITRFAYKLTKNKYGYEIYG